MIQTVSLNDSSMGGGISSKFKTFLVTLTQPKTCFIKFGARASLMRWLVSACQFYFSKKIKSMFPVFEFLLSLNWFVSRRYRSFVTMKCLHNAASLLFFRKARYCKCFLIQSTSIWCTVIIVIIIIVTITVMMDK